ncbi:MAG TPA: zinc ribbon domain-containing protein, partial [Terriglobales bacterium]|nr:zinc ribbon domain-containing protein [Terriglobales bacterium]
MAFCNSCGATLDGGAKFCTKCGATQPAGRASSATPSSPVSSSTATTATPQSSNALKVILIVVAVIVGLGILGVAAVSFIGYRIATHTRVRNQDGNVRVETPFGTVQSTTDPDEAARNLGIDLYPGAAVVKGTTSNMNMGNMHTAA